VHKKEKKTYAPTKSNGDMCITQLIQPRESYSGEMNQTHKEQHDDLQEINSYNLDQL
jgi:hypothetical protein